MLRVDGHGHRHALPRPACSQGTHGVAAGRKARRRVLHLLGVQAQWVTVMSTLSWLVCPLTQEVWVAAGGAKLAMACTSLSTSLS